MHQIFSEIGIILKQIHYRGSTTSYRKQVRGHEIIVELEPCDGGDGFRILVGSHAQTDSGRPRGKGGRVHARECPDCRPLRSENGGERWSYHQTVEERVAMITRIRRELSAVEGRNPEGG